MLRLPLLLLLMLPALPAPADPGAIERYRGTWRRVDVAREDAARHAEIDRVTQSMNFVFRTFARAVMRQRMRPVSRYEVDVADGVGRIRSSIGEQYPLDGQPHGGAEADAVTSRLEDGVIVQSWRHGADSYGTTVWRLDPSGERVVISERVHDPHFDQPIEFATTYRRVEPRPAEQAAR